VYLQNCHLYISWLPELERLCEELTPETVHKDFRLWLTSMPCAEFPVSVLQGSVKMTNEPPKGLRANLKAAYYKLDSAALEATQRPEAYKRLLFALCFFHANVQERRRFGPLGWNVPYEFNETDLDISRGQLEIFLDTSDSVPYRVLRFLTAYINYGGRVTDYIDLRTIDVIMRAFYTPRVLEGGSTYSFDADGVYPSPDYDPADPHRSYVEFIDSLPLTAGPGAFGMHENANISCALAETFATFGTVLKMEAGGSSSSSGSSGGDEAIAAAARAMAAQLAQRGAFDLEAIASQFPTTYSESMNTVLAQECARYNRLTGEMSRALPELCRALAGLVVMSAELEALSRAVALNAVPAAWEARAYPSLKPLGAWIEDLCARLDFLRAWCDAGHPPAVYWLSGLYFPQAFLTGTLQNYARKRALPIDTVAFDYCVRDDLDWESVVQGPEDGAYVRGLFLEGARWSTAARGLDDSKPKQLYTPLPVLHLRPVRDRVNPDSGVYRCPVYKVHCLLS
jgi:dynein heavy chain, axonemal